MIWQGTLCLANFDPFERLERGLAPIALPPRFDQYCETPLEGTSMAAPHVAGVAALLVSQGVTDPAAVEALIKATALDLGTPGRDNVFGYGLIQPRAALLGFGVTR
jgi:serine protease